MSGPPIRVAIVDDHPIVRAGIRAVLASAKDVTVVAEAANGADALQIVAEQHPDVLVLDVNLPDINGLEVSRRLRGRGDTTPIVILTVHNDTQTVLGLLEAGANGYVLKDDTLDRLAGAVAAAACGQTWLSPAVAAQVVRRALSTTASGERAGPRPMADLPMAGRQAGGAADPPLSPLTPRELEVLRLLALGLDNDAIAARLVLTKRTVQNHISTIYDKLDVTSRTEALLYAVQHGWAQLP